MISNWWSSRCAAFWPQQYNFKPDDKRAVFVFNMMKQLKQFQIITMGLKILLGFIGTLTLGIGGVGLMNIMLVAVTQRTREIGVEKALGGRRRDISVPVSGGSTGHYLCRRYCRNRDGLCDFVRCRAGLLSTARSPRMPKPPTFA